jgi:hypothetical protein
MLEKFAVIFYWKMSGVFCIWLGSGEFFSTTFGRPFNKNTIIKTSTLFTYNYFNFLEFSTLITSVFLRIYFIEFYEWSFYWINFQASFCLKRCLFGAIFIQLFRLFISMIHFHFFFFFFLWKRAPSDFLKNFEKLNNHSQQKTH